MDHTYDHIRKDFLETDSESNTQDDDVPDLVQSSCGEIVIGSPADDSDEPEPARDADTQRDFTLRLIELVRTRPNIYDKFDPAYKSPVERERSWINVAKSLSTSVSCVQNRWVRLRERFARERKAVQRMERGTSSNDNKKLWTYFLPLLFLSSHIKSRRKANTLQAVNETTDMTISKYVAETSDSEVLQKNLIVHNEAEDHWSPSGRTLKKRKYKDAEFPLVQTHSIPRKIVAKPEATVNAVYVQPQRLKTVRETTDIKPVNKLPAGAFLLRPDNPDSTNSQVVLLPTVAQTGVKAGGILIQSSPQPVTSKDLPVPNSAEHHFGMLVARELERFPPDIRNRKKQRILMVLYE